MTAPQNVPLQASMNDIEIRQVQLEDLPQISEVNESAFGNPSYPFSLRQNFDLFQEFCLVAVIKETVIGYCFAAIKPFSNTAWILSMGVLKSHQGEGIGSNMLKEACRKLEKLNLEVVYLTVKPQNKRAIEFYQNFGFNQGSIEQSYFGNGRDRYVMKYCL